MSEEIKMFEEAKKIIDQYFSYLKSKTGEDAAVLYSVYEKKGNIEVDLIIGDESEKVLGIRFLNKKKELMYDLIREKSIIESKNNNKDKNMKEIGKIALRFHLKDEDYNVNHDFVFYSKNGKIKKGIRYAEMIPKVSKEENEVISFSLDEELFDLQCQF
ncbi:MAG: hypothetical protein GY870_04120 [archaeon]|nr:hypothetical protein [archaeon]